MCWKQGTRRKSKPTRGRDNRRPTPKEGGEEYETEEEYDEEDDEEEEYDEEDEKNGEEYEEEAEFAPTEELEY